MDASEVNRVKFASQTDPKEEAFQDYIEKRHGGQMRPAVKSALERTMRERKWLNAQLAR